MNKHIIFQELAEQHLVLVTLFVSLHPLALTIIEDNCSGHSAQHLQDEVIHLPDVAPSCQHISYPLVCFGPLLWFQGCLPVSKTAAAAVLLAMVHSTGFLCCSLQCYAKGKEWEMLWENYMELTVSLFYSQTHTEQSSYFRAYAQCFCDIDVSWRALSAIVPWFRVSVYFYNSSSWFSILF